MTKTADRKSLTFVGLGLHDDAGISMGGFEAMRSAGIVFAEEYTSTLSEGSIDRLEKKIGKSIETLNRGAVEDGKVILDACANANVVFLVVGDPMTATTHTDLRLRAEKAGIHTKVIHGSSVLTAVPGLLGLQHYKFGRTTTIPFPQEGYSPTSPYEVIAENLSRGLHTLILLDIDAENLRYMTANEAMHALRDMERRTRKGIIRENTLICVVARAGSDDSISRAGELSVLMGEDFGPPLHTLVVPGKLHFMEEEALEILAGMIRSKMD